MQLFLSLLTVSVLLKKALSEKACRDTIEKYLNKVIRKGDYYSLNAARYIVSRHGFRKDKEDRLIHALEFINKHQGIVKAKTALKYNDELDEFKRMLRDLDSILVNPVTIPRRFKVKYIRNPLQAYYDKYYTRLVLPHEKKAGMFRNEFLSGRYVD